jgi:hypothetical protein
VQLTLETGSGEVLIRDMRVKPRPADRDLTIADHDPTIEEAEDVVDEADARCIYDAMQARTFPAPSARPGRHWQTWYWSAPQRNDQRR